MCVVAKIPLTFSGKNIAAAAAARWSALRQPRASASARRRRCLCARVLERRWWRRLVIDVGAYISYEANHTPHEGMCLDTASSPVFTPYSSMLSWPFGKYVVWFPAGLLILEKHEGTPPDGNSATVGPGRWRRNGRVAVVT